MSAASVSTARTEAPGRAMAMKPVTILLTEGFADWETGLLGFAALEEGLQIRLTSPDGGDVTSIAGMRVTGLAPFRLTGTEVVVICGGSIWDRPEAPDLSAPLRDARARGATVAAICGGVAGLARAGLLAGVAHTSNGRDWLNRVAPGYAGADLHRDQPQAMAEAGVITAAGTAPASFAAEVLAAAGMAPAKLDEFRALLAAEHRR